MPRYHQTQSSGKKLWRVWDSKVSLFLCFQEPYFVYVYFRLFISAIHHTICVCISNLNFITGFIFGQISEHVFSFLNMFFQQLKEQTSLFRDIPFLNCVNRCVFILRRREGSAWCFFPIFKFNIQSQLVKFIFYSLFVNARAVSAVFAHDLMVFFLHLKIQINKQKGSSSCEIEWNRLKY